MLQYTSDCAQEMHALDFKPGVDGYCWHFSQGKQATVGACILNNDASPHGRERFSARGRRPSRRFPRWRIASLGRERS